MPLDPHEKEELKDLFTETIQTWRQVDAVTHKKHHDFIDQEMKIRSKRRERGEAILKQVMGWGIIVALSGIGLAVWELAKKALKAH